jgi:citrate synthase
MSPVEETCGQELSHSAEVPDQLARLFTHVAENMDMHAAWVGTKSPDASREHDAMRAVAEAYRKIATAASEAASLMRGLDGLPPTAHDPARLDRQALAAWMRTKIAMQQDFARLLLAHAAMSERALAEISAD